MDKTTYYPPQAEEISARLEVNIMSHDGEVPNYDPIDGSGISWN